MNSLDIIAEPLAVGLLILAGHLPLGREVLRRGIIFIDLCIAQVAALGLVLAGFFHVADGLPSQIIAVIAAVATALALAECEKRWPQLQEAIIGCVYVVCAAMVLILLSGNPHGAESLDQLLAGQLLWVQWADAWWLMVCSAAVIVASVAGLLTNRWLFYGLFAVTITFSVPLAGIFLVFASLILPALAVANRRGFAAWFQAGLVGALGYLLGMFASLQFDWPGGPAIICCLALSALGLRVIRMS